MKPQIHSSGFDTNPQIGSSGFDMKPQSGFDIKPQVEAPSEFASWGNFETTTKDDWGSFS
jgi:hypothetical protein